MKHLIIVGCGSHAAEIVDYIDHINNHSNNLEYVINGMIDNTKKHYIHYNYKEEFMGSIDDHLVNKDICYVMGIGNLSIRTKVLQEFKLKGASFTTIIHPSALVSKSAQIGEGSIISHNVSIGPKAIIGSFNVINSRCTIGHDARVGDNNFLSPQVVLGGYAQIGNNNLLGTNSCLIPDITMGNNNKIMAGMAVLNKVNDNETVFFRFKEKLVVREKVILKTDANQE